MPDVLRAEPASRDGLARRVRLASAPLLAISATLAGCSTDRSVEPSVQPAPTTTTMTNLDAPVDGSDLSAHPLYQLLVSLIPGPCLPTTTPGVPPDPDTVEGLFAALNIEELPPPPCTSTSPNTPDDVSP